MNPPWKACSHTDHGLIHICELLSDVFASLILWPAVWWGQTCVTSDLVRSHWCFSLWTHGEGVGLLPRDGEAPGRQSHLVRQRLRDDEEHEGDVCYGDHRGDQDHQAVAVLRGQVGPDGRARHQTGREGRRDLMRHTNRLDVTWTSVWATADPERTLMCPQHSLTGLIHVTPQFCLTGLNLSSPTKLKQYSTVLDEQFNRQVLAACGRQMSIRCGADCSQHGIWVISVIHGTKHLPSVESHLQVVLICPIKIPETLFCLFVHVHLEYQVVLILRKMKETSSTCMFIKR